MRCPRIGREENYHGRVEELLEQAGTSKGRFNGLPENPLWSDVEMASKSFHIFCQKDSLVGVTQCRIRHLLSGETLHTLSRAGFPYSLHNL